VKVGLSVALETVVGVAVGDNVGVPVGTSVVLTAGLGVRRGLGVAEGVTVKVERGLVAELVGVEVSGSAVAIPAAVKEELWPLAAEAQPKLKPKSKPIRRFDK
jgi:hypothetical protein